MYSVCVFFYYELIKEIIVVAPEPLNFKGTVFSSCSKFILDLYYQVPVGHPVVKENVKVWMILYYEALLAIKEISCRI